MQQSFRYDKYRLRKDGGKDTIRRGLTLLLACTSVKVKRTFMVLAEIEQHNWLERLDTTTVNFGSGKRSLIQGGYLHPRYQITVPRSWKSEVY